VESGYRVISNHGHDSHQEVMHLHLHIMGGKQLGPMLEGGPMPPSFRK
jgi:diadenosine tetraphosphate (Ap4A) HIT family hydrolase